MTFSFRVKWVAGHVAFGWALAGLWVLFQDRPGLDSILMAVSLSGMGMVLGQTALFIGQGKDIELGWLKRTIWGPGVLMPLVMLLGAGLLVIPSGIAALILDDMGVSETGLFLMAFGLYGLAAPLIGLACGGIIGVLQNHTFVKFNLAADRKGWLQRSLLAGALAALGITVVVFTLLLANPVTWILRLSMGLLLPLAVGLPFGLLLLAPAEKIYEQLGQPRENSDG